MTNTSKLSRQKYKKISTESRKTKKHYCFTVKKHWSFLEKSFSSICSPGQLRCRFVSTAQLDSPSFAMLFTQSTRKKRISYGSFFHSNCCSVHKEYSSDRTAETFLPWIKRKFNRIPKESKINVFLGQKLPLENFLGLSRTVFCPTWWIVFAQDPKKILLTVRQMKMNFFQKSLFLEFVQSEILNAVSTTLPKKLSAVRNFFRLK